MRVWCDREIQVEKQKRKTASDCESGRADSSSEEERNRLYTTTYGVESDKDAVQNGCRKFIVPDRRKRDKRREQECPGFGFWRLLLKENGNRFRLGKGSGRTGGLQMITILNLRNVNSDCQMPVTCNERIVRRDRSKLCTIICERRGDEEMTEG